MRRAATILLGMSLLVAACGDDDAEPTATAGTAAATATSAAAEATTAPTVAATTTTAAAAETTPALTGSAAVIAAAADYLGDYEGEWNNTTFGSSGAMFVTVLEVNTGAGFILVQIDLDGNVFGAADPDPFVIEISTAGEDLHVGYSEFMGVSSLEIDEEGNFSSIAEPPGLGLPLESEGFITDTGFAGTYNIPGLAEGTWSVDAVG